jgi:hypothetical protein
MFEFVAATACRPEVVDLESCILLSRAMECLGNARGYAYERWRTEKCSKPNMISGKTPELARGGHERE